MPSVDLDNGLVLYSFNMLLLVNMRFSGPLFFWLWAVLGVLAAQEETTQYFEAGTTLTLKPDPSAVPPPASIIRWKYGSNLVVDWSKESLKYFGSFEGRTTLDPQTLQLDVNSLTLADSGQFSLETDSGTYGSHKVKVIKPPPTPSITTQPLVCDVSCALKCTADTKDLGPVTYEWKKGGDKGEWTVGDQLKNISSDLTTEKFSCRLITRVRRSEASKHMDNPLKPEPGKIIGIIVGILCFVAVIAVIAVLAVNALVKFRPSHQLSTFILHNDFLKKCIFCNQSQAPQVDPEELAGEPFIPQPPADPADPVQPADPLQPADLDQPADPVQPADLNQPADAVQLTDPVQPANGVAVKEDLEMGTLSNPDSNEDK